MNVLALDLGTTTGWATSTHGVITSGTFTAKANRYEGGGMRFLRFSRWLEQMLDPIDAVYFEEVRAHRGTDAAHVYGGLLAHLTSLCEAHNKPYSGIPVGTIKKYWTGKGNASKDEMISAATLKGFAPVDDNEADALAILHYVTQELF